MNPISLPAVELKSALAGFGKIISKRTALPVLNHVRVERTKTEQLELAGTDLDTAAIFRADAPAQGEPITLLVPYEDLNNAAKSCGREDTLLITQVEKERVALKFPVGGSFIEHRCNTLPVDEFPPIAEIHGEPAILNERLRQAVHDALQCASTDETRLILNGAYLDVSKPNAHYVVGTDGRHLFSSNSFALPLKESLAIPSHRFLNWKEFNADGDWTLRVGKPEKDDAPQFEIASNHWRFIARSFAGNYPNWRQVIPNGSSTQTTVEFDPESVDSIIQTAARMPNHDTINFAVGLEIKDRRVRLLAKSSSEDPWTRVELEGVKASGKDVNVHLNRHLLTKALRFGLNRLEIIDAMGPLRFSSAGRQMVVMPTRPDSTPPPPRPSPPAAPAAAAEDEPPTPTNPPPAEQPERKPMPENNGTPTAGAKRAATTDAEEPKPALDAALAQIEVVRGDFRNAIAGVNKLGDLLKQVQREQKTSEKDIQSVRQTLRSLQSVRI